MFPRSPSFLAGLALLPRLLAAADPATPLEPPVAEDRNLTIELIAQEPEIRTPTAVQVDAQGRIWVLENNTHFRPANYLGAPTDRVLVMDDFAENGRARRVTVYAEGFKDGMGLRLLPGGDVILSTRAEIFRLHDADGDGKADERKTLLKMQTTDNYPHNGLSGLAVLDADTLFVGLGENHGAPWTITASDGATVSGSDEGGVFKFDAEGRHLEHWAKGFWNPFGLAFDESGRLFALDNDPGAGSLCRFLYVVHHGDYGFRYRYGRTAEHPFLSWYGQIRGTLPPLCLSGEAPTGLLQCQGRRLGAAYEGELLGCTWDAHGVQRFRLEPKGAGYTVKPQWLLRGGYYFRPSGIAQAPDGSIVVADWADGSYDVHGKGRLWRVRPASAQPAAAGEARPAPAPAPEAAQLQALLAGRSSAAEAVALLTSADPYLLHGAIDFLARPEQAEALRAQLGVADAKVRLGALLALRRSGRAEEQKHLPVWLRDGDGSVRRAALQWIGEERLAAFQEHVATSLEGAPSAQTFQAYLAALQLLASGKPDPKITASQTVQLALDPARPAALRALALRLAPIEHGELPIPKLQELARVADPALRLEAVRILAARPSWEVQPVLRTLAAEERVDAETRAEALAGLAKSAATPENHQVLRAALSSAEPKLVREALRSLRDVFDDADRKALPPAALAGGETLAQLHLLRHGTDALSLAPAPAHPAATEPWPAVLTGVGDVAAGRRLFYSPTGPRCFVCHTIQGRGGAVGPDLTSIYQMSTADLLTAIREPSKDVAPAYQQWAVTLRNGSTGVGVDLFEDNKSQFTLVDATGQKTRYQYKDVTQREALPVSIMPPGLDYLMTEQEVRDLLAFLKEPRE